MTDTKLEDRSPNTPSAAFLIHMLTLLPHVWHPSEFSTWNMAEVLAIYSQFSFPSLDRLKLFRQKGWWTSLSTWILWSGIQHGEVNTSCPRRRKEWREGGGQEAHVWCGVRGGLERGSRKREGGPLYKKCPLCTSLTNSHVQNLGRTGTRGSGSSGMVGQLCSSSGRGSSPRWPGTEGLWTLCWVSAVSWSLPSGSLAWLFPPLGCVSSSALAPTSTGLGGSAASTHQASLDAPPLM